MGNERAKKKSLTTQELEIGGISAIAKQKQVFGVPHKELKRLVSRDKKPLVTSEPHFAHP